ncbi:lipoprotein [uncultured Flavobacterium sp.]|uniref:Rieske (2Fe-2S) protein n=1 Tax=uncultured Flavobacterium sp. TaxID=165435 RepID=UPI0025F31E47|nr:lipoprotein [uncultured Flavobacterium sp.]
MKKYIFLLFAALLLSACGSDDYNNNNRFLPNYNFSIDLDMNLPLYSSLQFPANPVRVNQAGIGINGVIVMNTGSGYVAYEATCPNQQVTACSSLTIDGINVVCNCDDAVYSLFTGLPESDVRYPLKPYRVQVVGQNVIRVYN